MRRTLLRAVVGLLLAMPGGALAQTGTVSGTVVDSVTSNPLPGANVVVEGTDIGAATGSDGEFRLANVPVGEQTLNVSFVGYQQKTQAVQVQENSTNTIRIQLASEAVGVDEVVVTALGVEREERAVSTSVDQVDGADLTRTDNENFVNSLQGKVAGANIRSGNTMGGSSNIVLRGYSSIEGNSQPLVVIDGIVIDNSRPETTAEQAAGGTGFDYGNAASTINPNNIESVSVLKGPSAAALYGSRGANGVLQITTKDGSSEDELGVSFSTEVTASDAYHFPDYQDRYGAGSSTAFTTLEGSDFRINGSLEEDPYIPQYAVDESWGPRLDGRPARHWYSWDDVNGLKGEATPWEPKPGSNERFLRTGISYNNNLAFTNGGDGYNYRLSLSSRNMTGVMPNSEMDRYEARFNGDVDISDDLTVTTITRFSYQKAEARAGTGYDFKNNPFAPFNTFGQRQLDFGPDSYMRDYERPNGQQRGWNYLGVEGAKNPTTFNFTDNPYISRFESFQDDDRQRVFGKAQADYDITEDLGSALSVTTDFYTERRRDRQAEISNEEPPFYNERILEVQETNGELRFDYNTDLSEDLDFSGLAATRARYETFNNNYAATTNGLAAADVFTVENSVGRPEIEDFFEEKFVYSLYGSANVGYNDLAFVEITLRNDWSSTLPGDDNSYFYPSVSGNLIFTELGALQGQDILSFGKVRASWAQVGNDTSPYQLSTVFPVNTPFQGQPLQQVQRNSNNPTLQPEVTTGIEFGTNLRFFGDRARLSATWYRDVTRNQILNIDVSSTTGVNSTLVNAGEIRNQGLEASFTVTPVVTPEFRWDVTTNFNRNVNEVVELAEGVDTYTINDAAPDAPTIQAREGQAYGALVGVAQARDQNGERVFTRNGAPILEGSPSSAGTFLPDWNGGISTTVSWKGLRVSALVDGQVGGVIHSRTTEAIESGMTEGSVVGKQRQVGVIPDGVVLPSGTDPSEASDTEGIPFEEAVGRMSPSAYWKAQDANGDHAFTYDATHAKLQEVSVTYAIPQSWIDTTPVQQASVSLTGNNLAILYKESPNIDPSVTLGAGNVQGLEAAQIPTQRTLGVRINLNF